MWTVGVLLLGCVVVVSGIGGTHIEELRRKISLASECIQRLVDCSAIYAPIAVGEINGSLFHDPKDLDNACRLNAEYIKCLESTQSFCVMENIGVIEVTMIRNRLWIRDLCQEESMWRKAYRRHSYCIIRQSFEYGPQCTRQQTPVDPRFVGLADLCRFFKGIVECTASVLKRRCGQQAADLFLKISLMKGNREYLCEEERIALLPRQDSPSLREAKQMLRNVRSLMANMSSVVKATLGEEDAAYVLQEMDSEEVERIRNLFKMKGGIKYGESPLFEMQDLIEDEDEEYEPQDEYNYQIIEVHTAKKKTKSQTKDVVKSQEEEGIEVQEGSYAIDWSTRLDEHYKSSEIDLEEVSLYTDASMHSTYDTEDSLNPSQNVEVDHEEEYLYTDASIYDTEQVEYPEQSLYSVQKGEDYPEDLSMHPVHGTEEIEYPGYTEESLYPVQNGEVDYPEETSFSEIEYPEDWTDSPPQSIQARETDDHPCVDDDCNESQSHLVQNDVERSDQSLDMDGPLQSSLFDKSEEENEVQLDSVLSDDADSDKILSEDGTDDDHSCKRLDNRLPEAFKSNASFHVYAIRNRGAMTHMGSGLTMAPWKTMTDSPLDDLFCSWLDPSTSRTLFKCAIKLAKLEPTEHGRKRPRSHPILLALYTSPTSAAAEVVSMSEVATICVEDYQPSEETLPPTNSKLKEYMHGEDSHEKAEVADTQEVEICKLEGSCSEKLLSFQKRALDIQEIDVVKNNEPENFCSMEELETKYSMQKRSLELLQENEVSDSLDGNLNLVFAEELSEHIKDEKETLVDQKLEDPERKHQTSHCQILDGASIKQDCQIAEDSRKEGCQISEDSSIQPILADNASSFVKSSDCPTDLPEIVDFKTVDFAEESDNPEAIDVPIDCKNGNIQTLVSTTIKPGVYAEVTSLVNIHPLNLKFGRGCRFAENVDYIIVGEPYHPTKSTLADSECSYFVPEAKPISAPSVGSLDAELLIMNGIDSILAETALEQEI